MKLLNILFLTLFTCLISGPLSALEIDEKLTLRIVKTSDSRKTILINRGQEDGIVKGDHAKFYLSVGVVARGVAIKISPTRSVWSLYRLVNADYIKDEQVMKLKITAPVKITKDDSRTLVGDDVPPTTTRDPRDLGIPLAQGAEDLNQMESGASAGAMTSSTDDMSFLAANLLSKNREVFGAFSYEARSGKTQSENNNVEYTGQDAYMHLDLGLEYHFKEEAQWYSRLSLIGAIRVVQSSSFAFEGAEIKENASFFGGGVNWYPFTRPSKVFKFVPFGQFMYYMGSVKSTVDVKSGTAFNKDLSGAISMLGFGGGVKYYLHNGWGAMAKVEFNSRVDQFSEDIDGQSWTKTSSGPRINMALSYRF